MHARFYFELPALYSRIEWYQMKMEIVASCCLLYLCTERDSGRTSWVLFFELLKNRALLHYKINFE